MVHCLQWALLGVALLFSVYIPHSHAQTDAPAAKLCNETDSIDFDPSKIAGLWYEVARNPAPAKPLVCIQLNVTLIDDSKINLTVSFSDTPSYPWVNQTLTAQIDPSDSNTQYGFNISYNWYGTMYPLTTYKLVATNYDDYAFVCGYTEASNSSTAFGIILTRQRSIDMDTLDGYEGEAALSWADFQNGTMSQIAQPATCTNGAKAMTDSISWLLMMCVYAVIAFMG